ncbi:MAG: transposase [Chitinophagaceae bacterium]|nr:transposase [Chitinophagaceae bacterium]
METKKLCCGIDVSHTKLDVCYQNNLGELFHLQVGNNNSGFQKIIEHTGVDYHFVMEATGVYYIRLAFYLHQQSCKLSVVNALSIKRYIQMGGAGGCRLRTLVLGCYRREYEQLNINIAPAFTWCKNKKLNVLEKINTTIMLLVEWLAIKM